MGPAYRVTIPVVIQVAYMRLKYQAKLKTAEQVAEQMESGWVIGSDSAVSQPVGLIEAFAKRAAAGAVTDVKVHTMLDANPMPFYVDDSLFGKMTGISWFSSGGARKAINAGYADLIPAPPPAEKRGLLSRLLHKK